MLEFTSSHRGEPAVLCSFKKSGVALGSGPMHFSLHHTYFSGRYLLMCINGIMMKPRRELWKFHHKDEVLRLVRSLWAHQFDRSRPHCRPGKFGESRSRQCGVLKKKRQPSEILIGAGKHPLLETLIDMPKLSRRGVVEGWLEGRNKEI